MLAMLRAERVLLALILSLFLILGFIYALITPAFEASDELWHYPMVRHLADGNPLPVQVFDPALAGPWNQEASQPPLYYYLGAALTFWIDQSDMEQVRWLNPHVDNGVITPDGNINLAIHDPAFNPWQGALLAVRLVRLASVLLGALTVYLTYRIAREVTPGHPEIALVAASLNAFLPMFLFISGAVNNDNLAIPLASLALLLMIRIITKRVGNFYKVSWWEWLAVGIVIGLAVLTKEGTLGLIPMAVGTAFVSSWQRYVAYQDIGATAMEVAHSPTVTDTRKPIPMSRLLSASISFIASLFFLSLPIIVIAGWWYYRNLSLYGDWLGWNAFIAVLGQRSHPASLLQLWGERRGFMMSFWGLFGGVNVPMAAWIYTVLNLVLILSIIGFTIYLLRLTRREWFRFRTSKGNLVERTLGVVERNFALIAILIFTVAVIYGLIQWATTTWSSQGRLVFTAISALCTLMAIGLVCIVDGVAKIAQRFGLRRRALQLRMSLIALPCLFLFGIAAIAPMIWIRPAYQPPDSSESLANRKELVFGNKLRLAGYDVNYAGLQPGESIQVRLEWEVLEAMDRDWSVFVHLNDPVLELPVAQRDMFPGRGLLATRLLTPGQRIVDEYVLAIPATTVAPAELELAVGLYDFSSGERLVASDGKDAALLEKIPLAARDGEYPNSLTQFFENGVELVGYSVDPRRVNPGGEIHLTTYWRPSQDLDVDYTFFAQVVGEDTTRFAAADIDPTPVSSEWSIGEVYEVSFPLRLDPTTTPDSYPLIAGMYTRTADGGFERAQLVTQDGRLTDDFLWLTQIKVDVP